MDPSGMEQGFSSLSAADRAAFLPYAQKNLGINSDRFFPERPGYEDYRNPMSATVALERGGMMPTGSTQEALGWASGRTVKPAELAAIDYRDDDDGTPSRGERKDQVASAKDVILMVRPPEAPPTAEMSYDNVAMKQYEFAGRERRSRDETVASFLADRVVAKGYDASEISKILEQTMQKHKLTYEQAIRKMLATPSFSGRGGLQLSPL